MSIRPLPEYEDGTRIVDMRVRCDPVEPVPIGTYIAKVFRVTGYDLDCDGSLMAQIESVDKDGEATGWRADCIGLYSDTTVVLDEPGDLHDRMSSCGGV